MKWHCANFLSAYNTLLLLKQQMRQNPVLGHGYTAANPAVLSPPVYRGDTWLATGDAALCFDPISSQGLFNSIYTGLTAAEAVNSYLDTGVINLTSI